MDPLSGSRAWRSAVDVAAMSYVQNCDRVSRVIDLIDDAIISHPNPPTITRDELPAARWPRLVCKIANRIANRLVIRG